MAVCSTTALRKYLTQHSNLGQPLREKASSTTGGHAKGETIRNSGRYRRPLFKSSLDFRLRTDERRNWLHFLRGDRSSEMEPLRRLRLLGSGPQLETPLQSSLMLQLAKVLEWLLGPTLPDDQLERQPTKPGESAPPARRSRPA